MNASSSLASRAGLLTVLIRQEMAARYRGTLLGRLWPLAMPLLMLAVYGFVFGAVFRARWPGLAPDDHFGFALYLLTGLLVHGLLGESVSQAPGLMIRHGNFVRKVVFPLPLLVGVPLGSALIHSLFGFGLVVAANGIGGSGWHWSALALPAILAPYALLLAGLSLGLAALGVYVRDIAQFAGVFVTLTLFLSPIFFPLELAPEAFRGLLTWNPVTWPVQAVRGALLEGRWPAMDEIALYGAVAAIVFLLGRATFAKLRRGFADVL